MSAVTVDDHLLREVLAGDMPRLLARLLRQNDLATTNLFYYRLCRAGLEARGGALTGSWPLERREQTVRTLLELPEDIEILSMESLAFRMAELAREYRLSALCAEAIAAAEIWSGPLCVWEGDTGPYTKACCDDVGVKYQLIGRR
jgi:hypothetical protein